MKVCPHINFLYAICKDPYDGIEELNLECSVCGELEINLDSEMVSKIIPTELSECKEEL